MCDRLSIIACVCVTSCCNLTVELAVCTVSWYGLPMVVSFFVVFHIV